MQCYSSMHLLTRVFYLDHNRINRTVIVHYMQILSQTYFRMVTVGIYSATAFRQLGIHQKFLICKEKVIDFSPTAAPALLTKVSLELNIFFTHHNIDNFQPLSTTFSWDCQKSFWCTNVHMGQRVKISSKQHMLIHLCYKRNFGQSYRYSKIFELIFSILQDQNQILVTLEYEQECTAM